MSSLRKRVELNTRAQRAATSGPGTAGDGTFHLPSVTLERLQQLQQVEDAEEQREQRLADDIEAGNFDLSGPGMRSRYQLPKVDERFNARLQGLQQVVSAEQNRMKPETLPMYRMTPAQRQGVYNGIKLIAELIENNVVRPTDEQQLRTLRRQEAARHSSTSAASLAIYKTGAPNLRYAQQVPRAWSEARAAANNTAGGGGGVGGRAFLSNEPMAINDHLHTLADTLFLDIRTAMMRTEDDVGGLVRSPTPAMVKQVQFPYFMMLRDELRSLQLLSQHSAFLNFSNVLYREAQRQQAPVPLRTMIERCTAESGLSLVCAQFRYDSRTIELVLKVNVEASYFGLLTFNVADVYTDDTQLLRAEVKDELKEVHKVDMAAATVRVPTLGRLHDEAERMRALSELTDYEHLASDYYKCHEDLARDQMFGTRVDRLVARSSPMRVMHPLKSKKLCDVPVRYCYAYFSNCQCFIDDADLALYKLRYANIARRQRTRATVDSELLPMYASDDEACGTEGVKRRRTEPTAAGASVSGVRSAVSAVRDDDDDDVDDKRH